MAIRFEGQVAIITGAGGGLGRAHALGLAALGAKVVVNDLGTQDDNGMTRSAAAEAVVAEIEAAGGTAIADPADISDMSQVEAMVERTRSLWGRVDVLINNAGILRDSSFAKMAPENFDLVVKVHLGGSYNCTKAVWELMREQGYGRILFTSSGSGIFGNFGQANYGAAKAALVGLMNVLHIEGQKTDIRVNTLAPTAATAMTKDLVSPEVATLLDPDRVTPAALYLVSRDAPSKMIMGAGAGVFAVSYILETRGVHIADDQLSPDAIAEKIGTISDIETAGPIQGAFEQMLKFIEIAKQNQKY